MQLSLPNTCCHKRNTTLSVVVLALWFSLALAIFVSPATLAAAPGTACNTTTTSSLLGTIGQSGECNGLLIVDRQMLDTAINRAMASPQQNYYIEDTSSGTNYNFGQVYVGNLTDMSNLFYDRNGSTVSTFNDNISVWDVSNVTKMNYMFGEAAAFNQDLTGWNVC